MEIIVDGADPVSTDIDKMVLSDEKTDTSDNSYHTIKVSITKEHCAPVSVYEKRIYVQMKPVTVWNGFTQLYCNMDDSGSECELNRCIYIGRNDRDNEKQTLRDFDDEDFDEFSWEEFQRNTCTFVMTKKTDYLRITSDLRESSDNIAQLNRRIDLSELVGYKR
uniref:hypothetical protein n=1 Tax=Treponema sp. TaxID=166 RepID=UPI00298EA393